MAGADEMGIPPTARSTLLAQPQPAPSHQFTPRPIDIADAPALASRIMWRSALLALAWTAFAPADHLAAQPAPSSDSVQWRGRAVCVDDTGALEPCAAESNRYALQGPGGVLRWFKAGDPLAAVFDDERVRAQDVVATVRPGADGTGELIKVYSAKHGKLHDVRYFCEICNVTSFTPGLCPCCRAEMELRETPVE